MKQYLSKNW